MGKLDINLISENRSQIEGTSLLGAFDNSLFQLQNLDIGMLKRLDGKRYEPGKWTVKDILQHISDTERILSAGALCIARNEYSNVMSFEGNVMANSVNANGKRIEQLLYEIETVRRATISLFKSFTLEELLKTGIKKDNSENILTIGFNIIIHQIHHLRIIEEKYYPLVK